MAHVSLWLGVIMAMVHNGGMPNITIAIIDGKFVSFLPAVLFVMGIALLVVHHVSDNRK